MEEQDESDIQLLHPVQDRVFFVLQGLKHICHFTTKRAYLPAPKRCRKDGFIG
jgi:hypothetical protein